jgi:hypothetical protein
MYDLPPPTVPTFLPLSSEAPFLLFLLEGEASRFLLVSGMVGESCVNCGDIILDLLAFSQFD